MDDPKWITVKSAFKLAQKTLYSEFAALEALDSFLSSHVVNARASAVAVDYDFGPVPKKYNPEPLTLTRHEVDNRAEIQVSQLNQRPPGKTPYVLPKDFFETDCLSRFERRLWRWKDGIMIHLVSVSVAQTRLMTQTYP